MDSNLNLHIDHVRTPRGRLPESEGGELALVGIHPDYDLPAHATPTDKDLSAPSPAPVVEVENPATTDGDAASVNPEPETAPEEKKPHRRRRS